MVYYIAQAGAFGSWVIYMKEGKCTTNNYFGVERTNIGNPSALSAGKHEISMSSLLTLPSRQSR
jgi:hypothetical protein